MQQLWQDKDKRRAALLSLVAHLTVLLLLVWVVRMPPAVPLDTFIVIDVGTPAEAPAEVAAATAEAPAPQAPTPQAAGEQLGEPQAPQAREPEPASPTPAPQTLQPPAPAPQQPQAAEQAAQAEPATEPQAEASPAAPAAPAAAGAPPRPQPEITPEATPEATADARPPRPAPPQPVTPSAPAVAAEALPSSPPTAALPEIESEPLEPRPPVEAIAIPQPSAAARLPEARAVAPTPQVQVAAPQAIPAPQASARVPEPQAIPAPQATPQVAAAEAIPAPQAVSRVAVAEAIPAPQASSRVAAAEAIPAPQASASVAAARPLPTPAAQASVAAARAIPGPQVRAGVGEARAVEATPQVQVGRSVRVPQPQVAAQLRSAQARAGAPVETPIADGVGTSDSNRRDARPAGGNAARSGQPDTLAGAAAGNRGLAAGPEGSRDPSGAPATATPYLEERPRPLAVLIDNADGYPQAGLAEASMILELPVEGGLTRLMAVYDNRDPERVGPVRSARDYFWQLSRDLDAILVHDGGSPSAMNAIQGSDTPTFNAFTRGELFARQPERQAPYNLYAGGSGLRQAINRLQLNRSRVLQGRVFRPAEAEPAVTTVTIPHSGVYESGFRYQPELDRYRWIRQGQPAVDAADEAVLAEAVLVGEITARPIPDDPAGRLYVPLRSGPATLYLRGRAIAGVWQPSVEGGVAFVAEGGEPVDLRPLKTWVVLTPSYERRLEN